MSGSEIQITPAGPPTFSIAAYRQRIMRQQGDADRLETNQRAGRLVPLAWCFAVGAWLMVVAMTFGHDQTEQLMHHLQATVAQWRAPVMPLPVQDEVLVEEEPTREVLVPPVPHNCDQARALGLAPARVGEPGYAPWLDGDHDGISCEPIRRHYRY